MSIDERLRAGLALNTEHLVADVESERDLTYGRAHHRQRVRRSALAVAAAAAVAVTAWSIDLATLDDDAVPITPNPRAPTDLVDLHGPLEPGLYSMGAWGETGQTGPLPRAILEVPDGYFSNGGYVIDSGHTGVTDDQFGEVSVWHAVQVLADPCRRSTAADVGPTVDDLARALVRQAGPSSQPRQVVIDGHRGLSLEVTVPQKIDLTACSGEDYALWRTEPQGDGTYSLGTPGVVNRLWILDVDGTRLVIAASLYPDETDELHQEQTAIAESIRFEPTDS
jgi:hypothetical protein